MKFVNHVTHGPVKLGRRRGFKLSTRPLSKYTTGALTYPTTRAWERDVAWGMLGNDSVGDCVIAYMLHQIIAWKAVAHAAETVSYDDDQAIQIYSAITGYVPGNESTDNGTDPDTALQYWQNTGLFGDNIAGFVNLDISNIDQIKWAINEFGGVGFSLDVPAYVMQVPAGGSWSEPAGADDTIEGGHQVLVVGYGEDGGTLVSWGTLYHFDWAFWSKYAQGSQAAVSPDWVKQSGTSPALNLNLQTLLTDMQSQQAA